MIPWSDEQFLYAAGIAPEREEREYFAAVNQAADLKLAAAVLAALEQDDKRVPAAPDEAAQYYRDRAVSVSGSNEWDYAVPLMDYRELDLEWMERGDALARAEAQVYELRNQLRGADARAKLASRERGEGGAVLLLCGVALMALLWGRR